ncbi:MAG: DUF7507 domain-containing protein [Actinomycetota bacterium]
MGSRKNSRRRRTSKRGLASFVSFVLLFAFALGQSSSLIALADDAGTDPVAAEEVVSDGDTGDVVLPEEAAPAEEAPAEETPADDAPIEEVPSGGEGDGGAEAASDDDASTSSGKTRKNSPSNARAGDDPVIQSHGGLHGGDVNLDFVAAGPFTYDHATGLGTPPQFGYDNRTVSKTNGIVESLEGGDFACDDLVTFFVEVEIEEDAGSGSVALDLSFGAETTGQPGLGFDDIVSWGINTPDGGNVGLDGDETVTLSNEHLDTSGYDEVQGTLTVSNLEGGETAIVRVTAHLACEVGASPTGNILNAINAARVVGGETINVGQETVPMKQVGGLQAEPIISVTKDCPATSLAGDEIIYEITVSNDGNEALVDLSVIDSLLGDITDEFGTTTLDPGEVITVQVGRTPQPGDGDPLTNSVTASATGDISDTDVSDDADCTTDVLNPDIDVDKTCTEFAQVGDTITYTITVTNTGDEDLEAITVQDSLLGDLSGSYADTLAAGDSESHDFDYLVTENSPDPVPNEVTATGAGVSSEEVVDSSANCSTDVLNPDIDVDKEGPALVHVDDTITYTFEVTNPGELELFDVELTDPVCDDGTISLVDDGDGSGGLAVGEVWHYTCLHLVTDEDPDPIPNTGTVRGDTDEGEGGNEVTDDDDHLVDIIHPAVDIVKTVDEDIVPVGATVTYTYVVTNTGDTTLYEVSVDDDILGHIGDIAVLEPGASVTLTADFVVGDTIVVNVATVDGEDILGGSVSADDDAIVTPIAGENPPENPPGTPPGTPFTGSDAGRLGLISIALLGIGVTVVATTRRRRPEREAA